MLTTSPFILACGGIAASDQQTMIQRPDHQQTQQQHTDQERRGMMGQGGMMGPGMMGRQ